MLFTSLEYYLFLPLVAVVYFLTPRAYRWGWLLVASYFFYMYWNPYYIILIVGSTLIDYWAALKMEKYASRKERRPYLWLSIIANLGLLFTFKYFNFFSGQASLLMQEWMPDANYSVYLDVLLPVGISFYTFQTMAYSIDVYKGFTKAERHLGRYALYVAFFPQLVAGPIERSRNLLSQFHFDYHFDYQRIRSGLQLILWGVFKKLVIADRLALFVDEVFNSPDAYQGIIIWVAAFFFLFQIYCDFSAYTDIAIGSARVLGVRLSKNFENRVYIITSFQQFWRGWHITLTNWFRDYVYFPLSRMNKGMRWLMITAILTFTLNGLWHGAEWSFIIWGALNGLFIAVEMYLAKPRERLYQRLNIHKDSWVRTALGFIVCFPLALQSIIFFRGQNTADALQMIASSFHIRPIQLHQSLTIINPIEYLSGFVLIALMDGVHWWAGQRTMDELLGQQQKWVRWLFYIIVFHLILYLGIPPQRQFIYFEF
jgi:D-alanyl-lipoteichoic acid acyltransferase DltB (MBOAT superfamily)